jgi:hypothetical protein
MIWYVHYFSGTAFGVGSVSSLPLAVNEACVLLDKGMDVIKIANSRGLEGMNAEEIRRVCVERKAKKEMALH